MSRSDELYNDTILDHYGNPRHQGRLLEPDVVIKGVNPLCGDEIELTLRIKDDKITEARFDGMGCLISQATASMMADSITGRDLAEVKRLIESFKELMRGGRDDCDDQPCELLGDLGALQRVCGHPARIKCTLLPWDTLLEALDLHAKAVSDAQPAGDR